MEYAARPAPYAGVDIQGFLQRVFMWMFAGLLVTAVVAGAIGANDSLLTDVTESPGILIGVFVVQIGLVIALSFAINRIAPGVALLMFFAYAALNGVLFAFIFELYTKQSIFTTFLITAGMFATLAFLGYTTKRDLSSLGTILFAALIALIIATVVNVFIANSALYWITTYAGVIIFAGLTAYDMQKLKRIGESGISGQAEQRASIQGALALYLDFINLFLFLLRIFGARR
jgi:FtsH-binding integral membrane protein